MSFDVLNARSQFPALADGQVHADGPGGTQVPASVADAVAETLRSPVSNRHGPFASSERADELVAAARLAIADLLGAVPAGVVLGPNMTSITFDLARTLARTWQPGDEVVVTRLDHDANVRPWVIAAERAGAVVRWADIDPDTCELPAEQFTDLVTERTRLVAVTAASNAVGTVPQVRRICEIAHGVGALVHVDGVHATPHLPVDLGELGADFYACSPYKFFGPHLGATVAAPELWAGLRPDKLRPSPDDVPDRFERGTQPFELYAGLVAAVDYLAALAAGDGTRRGRLLEAMREIAAYEEGLLDRLRGGLATVPGVTMLGAPRRSTPTVSFRLSGWSPRALAEALAKEDICVWDGNYYAAELMRRLGMEDGGAVRVGFVHYNTETEVDLVVDAVSRLAG